jgi:hypothetical protein
VNVNTDFPFAVHGLYYYIITPNILIPFLRIREELEICFLSKQLPKIGPPFYFIQQHVKHMRP